MRPGSLRRPHRFPLLAVLLVAALFAATTAARAAVPAFTQLTWLDDAGGPLVPYSHVVVVEFAFGPGDLQLLAAQGGGYLNLVTDTGDGPRWSVENLYVAYPDLPYLLQSRPTLQFDAGSADGLPLQVLAWSLAITAQPLAAPPQQPPAFAQVQQREYLAGGVDAGGSGVLELVASIGPFTGCHAADCAAPQLVAMMPRPVAANVAAVDEGTMGCVPAALARSLKYLFGDGALAGTDVQDIYGELYGLLGTSAATGTKHDAIKSAKKKYAKQHDLDVQTNDWNFKNGAKFGAEGLTAGADVEMRIVWPNGQGHFVMVTEIVALGKDKGYQIKYVDDPRQGDGQAQNQEHTITVDKDGRITSGGGGSVASFMVEQRRK